MEPVCKFTDTEFIQKRVQKIAANDNKLILDDGEEVPYDVLALNVGSRTRHGYTTPGVDEYALTTRPINELLGKIEKKEQWLKDNNITPSVVVCGAGCAGVELSFGFKARWEKLWGQEIQVQLVTGRGEVLPHEAEVGRKEIIRKLKEKNITVHAGQRAKEVTEKGVILEDGTLVEGVVTIWSTGAEPQKVTAESDLEISKGYFRVNECLQSTSHPNVFGGGDCITMANYEHLDRPFPPKAGVYAVRAGPILAQNLNAFIKGEELKPYVPQTEFLALMMTGDGKAVGTKFGIAFTGKWVWKMKDYIDVSFMHLFDKYYLFNDFDNKGYAEKVEGNTLYEDEKAELAAQTAEIKERVKNMTGEEGGASLSVDEDHEDFWEQLFVLTRMAEDEEFKNGVVSNFKPSYQIYE